MKPSSEPVRKWWSNAGLGLRGLVVFIAAVLGAVVFYFLPERWREAVQASTTIFLVILTGAYVLLTGKLVKAQEAAGRSHFHEQAISDLARLLGEGAAVRYAAAPFPLDLGGEVSSLEHEYDELKDYFEKFEVLALALPDPFLKPAVDCTAMMARLTADLGALNWAVSEEQESAAGATRPPSWEGVREHYERSIRAAGGRSWEDVVGGDTAKALSAAHQQLIVSLTAYRRGRRPPAPRD